MIVFLIAILAVALLVLGLSITLLTKGRNIQGDVGDNDDMKRMGLECATRQALREDAELRGESIDEDSLLSCSAGSCSTCSTADKKC